MLFKVGVILLVVIHQLGVITGKILYMVKGMTTKPNHYLSYLLRLWQIKEKGKLIWRASLESVHTNEKIGFPNLNRLLDYLKKQINSSE